MKYCNIHMIFIVDMNVERGDNEDGEFDERMRISMWTPPKLIVILIIFFKVCGVLS